MFFNKDALKSTYDVDQAARALTAAWDISFAPAPSFDGRKKNKLRDMVCELAGYRGGYQTFLAQLERAVQPMTAMLAGHSIPVTLLDGEEINPAVFDEELVDWSLVERSSEIEHLYNMISEASPSDRVLIEADLDMLRSWDDVYVWSSVSTNAYVSPTHDAAQFNAICEEVLEADRQMRSESSTG